MNQFKTPSDGSPASAAKDSWSALSWETEAHPIAVNRFPYRRGLCFYTCDGEPMSKTAVNELYAGLVGSNFISTYAATNPGDDFADSLAYFLMDRELGTKYRLNTGQGHIYDIMYQLHSPIFAHKYQYIADLLARPKLRYP